VRSGRADRRQSDDDGRVVMVSATAAGRARHEAVAQRRRKALEAMLSEFEEDERRQLAELLERFVVALDHLAAEITT
jgi:DNA-binding MarR family transcriptional regulator